MTDARQADFAVIEKHPLARLHFVNEIRVGSREHRRLTLGRRNRKHVCLAEFDPGPGGKRDAALDHLTQAHLWPAQVADYGNWFPDALRGGPHIG